MFTCEKMYHINPYTVINMYIPLYIVLYTSSCTLSLYYVIHEKSIGIRLLLGHSWGTTKYQPWSRSQIPKLLIDICGICHLLMYIACIVCYFLFSLQTLINWFLYISEKEACWRYRTPTNRFSIKFKFRNSLPYLLQTVFKIWPLLPSFGPSCCP